MKKICLILLILPLLLTACRGEPAAPQAPLEQTAGQIREALGNAHFVAADEDFIQTNFSNSGSLCGGLVFFGDEDTAGEWGVFLADSAAHAAACEAQLREYLQTEREAIASLASLYPAQELQERLALYENATVGSSGTTVYYFALNKELRTRALRALEATLAA
jgi:hypothetical protein